MAEKRKYHIANKSLHEKLEVNQLQMERERQKMDAERQEMKVRVGMIERAYKRDMKQLEKVHMRMKLEKELERRRSQEPVPQWPLSARSVERVVIPETPKEPSPAKLDPKAPSYTKIALKRKKLGKAKTKSQIIEDPGEKPKKNRSTLSPGNWARIKKLTRMHESAKRSLVPEENEL